MKKILLIIMVVMPLLAVGQTSPSGRQTIKIKSGRRYWEYLPPGYAANPDKKYTVVIFFHGQGQKGNYDPSADVLTEMKKVFLADTPPAQVESYDFPFILLSPQLQSTQNGWYQSFVDGMINIARDPVNYRADLNNIYVVGLSLGGAATWAKALTATNAPKLRGLVPVCPAENNIPNACLVAQNNIRVWNFHGSLDTVTDPDLSIDMIEAINNCNPAPPTPPILTIYEGQNHDIWDEAFKLNNDLHLPNVYQWIMESHPGTPKADAGANKVITLPANQSTTLAGSGTDADGSIASYQWTKTSGGTVTMSGTNTSTLQLSNLQVGEYVFRLQVKDNSGWPSTPDEIKLKVEAQTNILPVVNAGSDKILKPATATYKPSLTGTATDSDGTITSYQWSKISGGQVTLVNANTQTVLLEDIIPGLYIFRLTATDNLGGQAYDDINIRVNEKPIPNAGPDITLTLPTNSVSITGTATDPDGTVVGYLWEQYSGSPATMSGTNTQTLSLTGLIAGIYGFRLTAFDNDGSSNRDYVTVHVNESSGRVAVSSEESLSDEESVPSKRCGDCSIVIYSTQGEFLYKGEDNYDAYRNALGDKRFFHYTLLRNNKKVKSGKVFITE